jgi:hypothetical protein
MQINLAVLGHRMKLAGPRQTDTGINTVCNENLGIHSGGEVAFLAETGRVELGLERIQCL